MSEEPQVRPGFLPPKAPGSLPAPFPAGPVQAPPQRPTFVAQRMESGPRSPLAISGTAIGCIALLLLVLSFGLGYFVCGMFSLTGLMLGLLARQQIQQRGTGRAGQARAAIWVCSIGLGLSILAFIVWAALDASGYHPEDLRNWLEKQLEAQRSRN